jgi:hypothetical protein
MRCLKAMRCLKRRLSDVVYRQLLRDAANLTHTDEQNTPQVCSCPPGSSVLAKIAEAQARSRCSPAGPPARGGTTWRAPSIGAESAAEQR